MPIVSGALSASGTGAASWIEFPGGVLRCVAFAAAAWSPSLAGSTGVLAASGSASTAFVGSSVSTAIAVGGFTYEAAASSSYPIVLRVLREQPPRITRQLGTTVPTATFRVGGTTAPANGQDVQLDFGDGYGVLFAGVIQNVASTGMPLARTWDITVVDYIWVLGARCPYGCWSDVSATTVVQALVAIFGPGFTATNVEASLPLVTVVFDGTKNFIDCLNAIAQQVGQCYFYVDTAKDLHFFQTDATNPPDTLTNANPKLLLDLPLVHEKDDSQIRNRVTGLGVSTTVAADAPAGATLVEIDSGVYFSNAGRVASGCQRFSAYGTYVTSVSPARAAAPDITNGGGGGGGSTAWTAAQVLATLPPYNVAVGKIHVATRYAIAEVDASGNESALSEVVEAAPYLPWNIPGSGTTSTALAATTGGSVPQGVTLDYAASQYDAEGGETQIQHYDGNISLGGSDNAVNVTVYASWDTRVAGTHIWRREGGLYFLVGDFPGRGGGTVKDTKASADLLQRAPLGAFGTQEIYNSTGVQVDLFNLPTTPAGTSRKLYRSTGDAYNNAAAWSPFRLLATLDNATTAYRDTKETPRQDQVEYNRRAGLTSDGLSVAGQDPGDAPGEFPAITHTYLQVSGLSEPLPKGSKIQLFLQLDDTDAQKTYAARIGGDGVRELPTISDESLVSYAALARRLNAQLMVFKHELESLEFISRDTKMQIGKPLPVNLTHPPIVTTLMIQTVSLDQIGPNRNPRFRVTASSVKHTWQDFAAQR